MILEGFIAAVEFISVLEFLTSALGFIPLKRRNESRNLIKAKDDYIKTAKQQEKLLERVENLHNHVTEAVQEANALNMADRIEHEENISMGTDKLEKLIRLLSILKTTKRNVSFALIFQDVSLELSNERVLGLGGSTKEDSIRALVLEFDKLVTPVSMLTADTTVYVLAYSKSTDNMLTQCSREGIVSAVLCCITMEIFGLPSVSYIDDLGLSDFDPRGRHTIALLRRRKSQIPGKGTVNLKRAFIIGTTRSGKSSLGNSLLGEEKFKVGESMTCTLGIGSARMRREVEKRLITLEIIDTPGINDKDKLDKYYETIIEGHVQHVQQASKLIIVVNVTNGLDGSFEKALKVYEKLFGNQMKQMLYVVITLNKSASDIECNGYVEMLKPSLKRATGEIAKGVMCVSIPDLKSNSQTFSHTVIKDLLGKCLDMDMKIIKAYEDKRYELTKLIEEKREIVHDEVAEIEELGWKKYRSVSGSFEGGIKHGICKSSTSYDGFVYRKENPWELEWVREIIQLKFASNSCRDVWTEFLNSHRKILDRSLLMEKFENLLRERNLALVVSPTKSETRNAFKTVNRTFVVIFDPTITRYELLRSYIDDLKKKEARISDDFWNMFYGISL